MAFSCDRLTLILVLLLAAAMLAGVCEGFSPPTATTLSALRDLYTQLNGESWFNNSGWADNGGADYCSGAWFGIACRDGLITHINLTANNINSSWDAEFAPYLSAIPSLEVLDFSDNVCASGILPSDWRKLQNLTTIVASNSNLSGVLLPEWSDMTSIEVLELADCYLRGPLPPRWSSMTKLRRLIVTSNSIVGSVPGEWMLMPSLESIEITQNMIVGALPIEWGSQASLIKDSLLQFSAGFNNISAPFPESWYNMTKLNVLMLNGNSFLCDSANPFPNRPFQSLSHLYLAQVGMNQGFPEMLVAPDTLKFYSLSSNNLSGTVPLLAGKSFVDVSGNYLSGNLGARQDNWKELVAANLAQQGTGMMFFVAPNNHNIVPPPVMWQIAPFVVWNPEKNENSCKSFSRITPVINNMALSVTDAVFVPAVQFGLLAQDFNGDPCKPAILQLGRPELNILIVPVLTPAEGMPWSGVAQAPVGVFSGMVFPALPNITLRHNVSYSLTLTVTLNQTEGTIARELFRFTSVSNLFSRQLCSASTLAVSQFVDCVKCPQNAVCDGSVNRGLIGRAWTLASDSYQIYQCPVSNYGCIEEESQRWNQCKEGYTGLLCSKCEEGYGKTIEFCVKCASTASNVTILILILCLSLAMVTIIVKCSIPKFDHIDTTESALLISASGGSPQQNGVESPTGAMSGRRQRQTEESKRRRYAQVLKMLVNYLQLMQLIGKTQIANLLSSGVVSQAFHVISLASISNELDVSPFSCLFPPFDAWSRFKSMCCCFVGMLVVEALISLMIARRAQLAFLKWNHILTIAFVCVLQVCYMFVIEYATVLLAHCDTYDFASIPRYLRLSTDGGYNTSFSRLSTDLTVECDSTLTEHRIVAVAVVALFGLGMPGIIARAHLYHYSSHDEAIFEFLTANYDAKFWYWELVLMLRKLFMKIVTVLVVVTPAIQAFTLIVVFSASAILHLVNSPFVSEELNRAESTLLAACIATLLLLTAAIDAPLVAEHIIVGGIFAVQLVGIVTFAVMLYKYLAAPLGTLRDVQPIERKDFGTSNSRINCRDVSPTMEEQEGVGRNGDHEEKAEISSSFLKERRNMRDNST